MTRIRYTNKGGLLESKDFISPTKVIKVVLNPEIMEGYLISISENIEHAFETFKATTLIKLKEMAKYYLINQGVNFQPEVRPGRGLIKDDFGPDTDLFKD